MTGKELCSLMRRHRVTVKALAARMKVTQKRVREVRAAGLTDCSPMVVQDWTEAVCGPVPAAKWTCKVCGKPMDWNAPSGVCSTECLNRGQGFESPVLRQFRAAKEKHPGVVVLFRAGDFYETFDADAELCAEVLGLTVTKRDGLSMAGMPHHSLDRHLATLLQAGHRVAVCEPVAEAPASAVVERVVTDEPCPDCGDGEEVSNTCDACGERHCQTCEPCGKPEKPAAKTMKAAKRVTKPVDPTAPKVRPVLLLPANLATLAKLVAKDNPRYAMNGVLVESTEAGYRCVATDGKVLGVVVGEPDDADAFPELPALKAAEATKSAAVLPTKAWTDAFKSVSKRTYKPVLNNVAVAMGENTSTLATTDLDQANVLNPRNVDGRYPAFEAVFPKRKPKATFRVDANLLVRLLQVAAQVGGEDNPGVTVEVFGEGQPVAVRVKNKTQKFDGLVMPLS